MRLARLAHAWTSSIRSWASQPSAQPASPAGDGEAGGGVCVKSRGVLPLPSPGSGGGRRAAPRREAPAAAPLRGRQGAPSLRGGGGSGPGERGATGGSGNGGGGRGAGTDTAPVRSPPRLQPCGGGERLPPGAGTEVAPSSPSPGGGGGGGLVNRRFWWVLLFSIFFLR